MDLQQCLRDAAQLEEELLQFLQAEDVDWLRRYWLQTGEQHYRQSREEKRSAVSAVLEWPPDRRRAFLQALPPFERRMMAMMLVSEAQEAHAWAQAVKGAARDIEEADRLAIPGLLARAWRAAAKRKLPTWPFDGPDPFEGPIRVSASESP